MGFRILDYRPPRIALLLLLAAVVLHRTTPLGALRMPSSATAGVLLAVAGFTVMTLGWWLFRKHGTAICPTATTERLVTGGIYRYTRNPMYLGLVAMLSGIAVAAGSLPFYLAAAACFVILDRVFRPYEEKKLTGAFNGSYQSYKNRVRPWL